MSEEVNFVRDLAVILISAGIITIICRALKQPALLGYVIAGFIIGPHMGVFGISSMDTVELWSEIGIIFLMFGLGLEFSFKKLLGAGTSALVTAGSKFLGAFVIGFVLGQAIGWSTMESIFLAGMLSMSSTMVVVKNYSDMGLNKKPYAAGVFGTLVVEDLIAILLMVLLSTLAVAGKFSGGELLLGIFHTPLQTQSMHVDQRVLTAMTYKETVDFDVQRQVLFALVGAIENHRRMMERGKIEPSQIHIEVGPLIGYLHTFLQDSRASTGCHQDDRYGNQQ